MKLERRRNGFYLGAIVGFFGYLIQQKSDANSAEIDIADLLLQSCAFSIFSGVLFLLGLSALAGRGHADNTNSQKYDNEIRSKVNKEVAAKSIKPK